MSGTSRFNRELSSFVLGPSCNYVLSVVGFAFLNRMLIQGQFSEGSGGFVVQFWTRKSVHILYEGLWM